MPAAAAPKGKPPRLAAALVALIAATVVAVAPHTRGFEGSVRHSYPDQGGVWTGGTGHTGPDVRPGMVVSQAQDDAWLKADLTAHTTAVLAATPELAEMPSALRAAADFSFNAGDARWKASPMAVHFGRRSWRAGCDAFRGYITLYRAPKLVPGQACRRNTKGVLYCEAKGLVRRREAERAMCLAGLPK